MYPVLPSPALTFPGKEFAESQCQWVDLCQPALLGEQSSQRVTARGTDFKVMWPCGKPIIRIRYVQKWLNIYQQIGICTAEFWTLVGTAVTQMYSARSIGQRNHDVRSSCIAQPVAAGGEKSGAAWDRICSKQENNHQRMQLSVGGISRELWNLSKIKGCYYRSHCASTACLSL